MATADLHVTMPTDAHVALKLRAGSKQALLAELARRAAGLTGIDEGVIVAALAAREALGSTGFGQGVAVPHARIDGLASVLCFLARLDRPVAFDSIDGAPIDLAVLLLSPRDADAAHLATLAALSRRLRDRTTAAALRGAVSPAAARALLA